VLELASFSEPSRQRALERFLLLRAHLEDGGPLAPEAKLSHRTLQHWLERFRTSGHRLTSREIATLHVRRTKLVSALDTYMETADRPFWWIAAEIGTGRPALRNWKNGKTKPQFKYLDRIEAFLRRQKYAGRNSSEILNAFRRFYRETSLSDYAIARKIGVDPAPLLLGMRDRLLRLPRRRSSDRARRSLKAR
jgi:hypothetical protein